MRSLLSALFFVSGLAQAASGDVLVTCTKTTFNDLEKIEIVENDKNTSILRITDGSSQVSDKLLPNELLLHDEGLSLPSWNGFERTLNIGSASISYHDECSGGVTSISCK